MSTPARTPKVVLTEPVPRRAVVLTRWAWAMVPMLVVSFVAAFALGTAFMAALGVAEGDLLVAAGPLGWLAALAVLAVGIAPAVVGVVLGLRATRAGGGVLAVSAFVVNGLLALYLAVVQLAQAAVG